MPGRFSPLLRSQLAADRDDTVDVVALDTLNDELDKAVVERRVDCPAFTTRGSGSNVIEAALRIADDVVAR
jgi:hypothetical protein